MTTAAVLLLCYTVGVCYRYVVLGTFTILQALHRLYGTERPIGHIQHADCIVQMIGSDSANAATLQVFKKWDLNLAQFKAQPVWRQRMQKQTVGLF